MGILRFTFLLAVLIIASNIIGTADCAVNNVITEWNYATQQVVRTYGISSQIASRYYALVHLSQYRVLVKATHLPETERVFVAAAAAHTVLSTNFPVRQSGITDALLKKYALDNSISLSRSNELQNFVRRVVVPILNRANSDGTQTWAFFTPATLPTAKPGQYQFTPNQTFAVYPQLGKARPFIISNPAVYDKQGGPSPLNSAKYNNDRAEVLALGNASVTTQANKDTANFWADGAATSAVPGHLYNLTASVLPASTSLLTTARIFAKQGVASFDASVAAWYQKYKYLFWRPFTAITLGDPAHPPEAFSPFLNTPPHPEYPSGHSVSTGAHIGVLISYLNIKIKDPYRITIGTEFPGLLPRTYSSFYELANEVGLSRIYAGIHFRKSIDDGLALGLAVANTVYIKFPKKELIGY